MYSDRRGNGQKPPRTKSSRQTTLWQNSLDKIPREQLREYAYRRLLSGFFVLGLLKMGEGPRCATYFGGSRDVWQSVTRGKGSKLAKIAWRTLWTAPEYEFVIWTLQRHPKQGTTNWFHISMLSNNFQWIMHSWKRNKLFRRPTEEDCYRGSRMRITVSVATPEKRTLIGKLIIIFFDRNVDFKAECLYLHVLTL